MSWAEMGPALIKEARELLCPTKVKTGRFPRWLRLRLQRIRDQHNWYDLPRTEYHWILERLIQEVEPKSKKMRACRNWRWLDHWGSTDWNFQDVFVAEPYDVDAESLRSVARVAELLDATYLVDANSWHYPGRTIRIIFMDARKTR